MNFQKKIKRVKFLKKYINKELASLSNKEFIFKTMLIYFVEVCLGFIIKLAIENEKGTETIEEVIQFKKEFDDKNKIGLSLAESKQILKTLQSKIILNQTTKHIESKRACEICHKNQAIKGYHTLHYHTLFGIVNLQSPRLFHCKCHDSKTKTFSPLSQWLSNKNDAELQYIETKWASLISFE